MSTQTEKLQPWGCDQQGRYLTRANPRYDRPQPWDVDQNSRYMVERPRYDHWAHEEWRDTIVAARKPYRPKRKPVSHPLTLGDLLMAAFVVGALVLAVSLGPWL